MPPVTSQPRTLYDLVVMWDDSPETSLTLLQHGLQRALVSLGVRPVRRAPVPPIRLLARAFGKAGLIRPLFPRGNRISLTVLSWASDARTFPDCYWRAPVPWIFDCWEPQFARWERLLRRHQVKIAFFSSKAATDYFGSRIAGLETHWVPEACDPENYRHDKRLVERSYAVLELGRKWPWLHERIREPLSKAGINHLYSDMHGAKSLFPDTEALHTGLSDTSIMLCFPRSITHPESAGGVETLTQRYLEGIASGCLVVGRAPQELIDLFGFNPVIELDFENPAEHILRLLRDLTAYENFVLRARKRLLEVGTFAHRAQSIVGLLRARL